LIIPITPMKAKSHVVVRSLTTQPTYQLIYSRGASPTSPQTPNTDQMIAHGALCNFPAFFFAVVVVADVAGEVPVAVALSVPNIAGSEAVLMMVVITETLAGTVVAAMVVGGTTMVVSIVDIGVGDTVVVRTAGFDGPADTVVVTTEANTTLSGDVVVNSAMVVAGTVVSGNVVVKVRVISSPNALAGIAVPTPDAVNWVGIGKAAVFGFAASFAEYIFPLVPFSRVKSPVSRFAVSSDEEVYAPPTIVPKEPSGRK